MAWDFNSSLHIRWALACVRQAPIQRDTYGLDACFLRLCFFLDLSLFSCLLCFERLCWARSSSARATASSRGRPAATCSRARSATAPVLAWAGLLVLRHTAAAIVPLVGVAVRGMGASGSLAAVGSAVFG